MGQSLFKKHSKLQNFDDILQCGMTRFSHVKLGVFRSKYKNYFKKEKQGTELFKKL